LGKNTVEYNFQEVSMKKDLLTVLCITLVCATVMLGIMGIYRIASVRAARTVEGEGIFNNTAFKIRGINYNL
jgi:hypothetical protein